MSQGNAGTYWEAVAQSRWGRYVSQVEEEAIRQAAALAGPPGAALEVGCEGGRWSHLLTGLGWRMTCTDVNATSLALCQARIPSARCVLVDESDTRIPCETGSVRLLLCIEVMAVLGADWFLTEAHRVLGPGGVVVGVFNNQRSWRGWYGHVAARLRRTFDFYAVAYPGWRQRFRAAGFEMVSEQGICWFPFGRASDSPLVPACVNLERFLGLRRLKLWSPWIVFVARRKP